MGIVHRVVLFKVTDPDHIPKMVEMCRTLKQDALKDGKPYILRYLAGPTMDEPRNQGFNFCTQSSFASLDDMKYYDNECKAHAEFKNLCKGKLASLPLTVFMEHYVGDDQ